MTLGPTHGNPFIEGNYPCTDPEILDVNCEDCPVYPACAKERNADIPQDQVPFPGANLVKNLNLIAGRVSLNLSLNNFAPRRINSRINPPVSNQQFLSL